MTRWLLIPIVITSCIVTYDYHHNPTGWYDPALFFLPLTMLLTVLLLRRLPTETPTSPEVVTWRPFTRLQMILPLIGVICFLVIAQVQATYPLLLKFLFGMHHAHQFALLVLGISLIIWGMTGGFSLSEGWRQFRAWTHESDAKWVLLFVVLGLVVRTIALEWAIHFYLDEANFASAVARLRVKPNVQIMNNISQIANFTWMYSYFQYYYTEVFGATLANLRATSVIVGTLTIPAIYLLGRWAYSRRIALLASFLLAFYLPHVHFSRLALNNIADPLLGVMAIALLWRGLQTESRPMLAMAGVFLGLTSYFYEGGRLFYPALIVGWLMIYAVMQPDKLSKRGIGTFLTTTILIASGFYLSLGVWGLQNIAPRLRDQRVDDEFWAELLASSDVGDQISRYINERLNPPYLHIVSQPDGSKLFYGSKVSLVLPHMLPFMLIGLGAALYHWRGLGLILFLWLILTVLGNSLLAWNNVTPRFVVLFPALVLLIALGLDTVYHMLMVYWLKDKMLQRMFRITVGALLLLMEFLQIVYYFGVILPDINIHSRLEIDAQDASHRAQFLPPDTEVFIFTNHNRHHLDVEIVQDYELHETIVQVIGLDEFDFMTLDTTGTSRYAFFVVPDDNETMTVLRELFGDHLIGPMWSPFNVPSRREYALYQVKA